GSGPLQNYWTIDTAATDGTPYITGVVYNDVNSNGRYDIGEGLGGVTVTVMTAGGDGLAAGQPVTSTTTWTSGGYSIAVSPGNYPAEVGGGALPGTITKRVTVGATNVRLNFPPAVTGATSATIQLNQWVALVYQDVLGRPASQAEIALWSNALLN